jgi:hypothetical protein
LPVARGPLDCSLCLSSWRGGLRHRARSLCRGDSVKVACMAMECGSEAAALVAGSALPAHRAPPGAPKRELAPALHGASRAERSRNLPSLTFTWPCAVACLLPIAFGPSEKCPRHETRAVATVACGLLPACWPSQACHSKMRQGRQMGQMRRLILGRGWSLRTWFSLRTKMRGWFGALREDRPKGSPQSLLVSWR